MRSQSEKERCGSMPFWMQIVLILLCGVLLSVAVYWVVGVRDRTVRSGSGTVEAAENIADNIYTVTFAYQDGTVIDSKQVHEGKGVFPPTFEADGVFRGWSGAFNQVTSNVETHPMVYRVSDDENLFCFDSVYVQEGEAFTLDLMLTGIVNISSAKLYIEYDPEVMAFEYAESIDGFTVAEDEAGQLSLTLESELPLRETVCLSHITFSAKPEDVYSTEITLRCESGKLDSDGIEYNATVTTLNNNIYYLQEVE